MVYKPGMIVDGIITGIQPYGAFVLLDDKTSGLIHISEISYGFVKDVKQFVEVGETVKVKVIDIEEEKGTKQVRLSLKTVDKNPIRKDRMMNKWKKLKKMKIGFGSIKKQLPIWIKEAMEENNHDKIRH